MIRKFLARAGLACLATIALISCGGESSPEVEVAAVTTVEPRPEIYADFTLTADLSHYTDGQREMIGLLIDGNHE